MLPVFVAKIVGGRAVAMAAVAGAAVSLVAVVSAGVRARSAPQPAASIRAPWVETCAAQMDRARVRLVEAVPELGRSDVRQAWSTRGAWAELAMAPQYSARIEYRPHEDAPQVFDWEETATPVAGSFALHRHVGHYDLTIVADDSDDSGLMFAARMQPLLDECLMEAQ